MERQMNAPHHEEQLVESSQFVLIDENTDAQIH